MRPGLRVLMVAHSFPPYVGGLSYVVENLSRELVSMGHRVEVVTLDIGDGLPPVEERDGVLVRRFRGYAPDRGYFIPSRSFINYVSEAEADVYHLHNIGALTVPAAWLALRRKKRDYVITPHYHRSGYTWHAALLWRPYKLIARRILREARAVHTVSRYEAELVKQSFGVDSIVVPNGVSRDVLGYKWSPPRRPVIVYAGRMEHYKRVDRLVEAAALLAKKIGEKPVVKLIGRGPALEKALRLASELGVEIRHHDFLPRRRYLEELATSTVFVNLSRYEAYSIVTAEAIAIGLPVVAAKPWGRTFEGIDGVWLVDPDDLEETVEAIRQALSYTPRRPGHAIPTWREVAEEIVEKVYAKALS